MKATSIGKKVESTCLRFFQQVNQHGWKLKEDQFTVDEDILTPCLKTVFTKDLSRACVGGREVRQHHFPRSVAAEQVSSSACVQIVGCPTPKGMGDKHPKNFTGDHPSVGHEGTQVKDEGRVCEKVIFTSVHRGENISLTFQFRPPPNTLTHTPSQKQWVLNRKVKRKSSWCFNERMLFCVKSCVDIGRKNENNRHPVTLGSSENNKTL